MDIIIRNHAKADIFTAIFQHMKNFTDHINIMFERDRLYIQCMDSARVSIFEIDIPSKWFDEYRLTGSTNANIGVSSTLLYKILNARDKTHTVHLFTADDKLAVNFTSVDKTTFDKKFEIPLIDLDSELLEVPVIDYQAEFSISSAHFANIIGQLKIFGDTMEMKCTEEMVVLYANSQENGKMCVEIKIDELTAYAIEEGEELVSSFSIQYLQNICLYNKLAKEVDVMFSREYPLKIVYFLGEKESSDLGKITFYLAPKIETE